MTRRGSTIVLLCLGLLEAGCTRAAFISDGGAVADARAAGTEGGHCYPSRTCNAGLTCLSDRCVRLPDAGRREASKADAHKPDALRIDYSSACTEGQCHPGLTGQRCIGGSWQMPPCLDPVNGCGDDLKSPFGFCDPRWSGCVGPTPTGDASCAHHCESIGKICGNVCVTSRGYGQSDGAGKWGAEAWLSEADCKSGSKQGLGQKECSFPWNPPNEARWRCCCL